MAAWQRVSRWLLGSLARGKWTSVGLAGVVVIYFSLGSIYALGVPHLVSYDEPSHVAYVMSIWRGKLPHFDDPMRVEELGIRRHHTPQIWVGIHPPTYYAILAPFTGPSIEKGDPKTGVRRARLVSLAIGAIGLVYAFLSIRLLFRDRPVVAVAGTLFGAAIPFFLSVMGAVFNDSGDLVASTALIYTSLALLLHGPSTPRLLHATFWFGLACFLRLSTLFTMAPALLGGFAAYMLLDKPLLQRLWRAIAACTLLVTSAAATSGWWYLRNQKLYDDFTGAKPALVLFKRTRGEPWHDLILDSDLWVKVYDHLWSMFLAGYRLGDDAIQIGRWYLYAALVGLVIAGVRKLARPREALRMVRPLTKHASAWAIALGVILLCVAFRSYSLMELHSRGGTCNSRYLFTLSWIFGTVLALGFSGFHRRWGVLAAAAFVLIVNVLSVDQILSRYLKMSWKASDMPIVAAFQSAGVESPTSTFGIILACLAAGFALVTVAVVRLDDGGRAGPPIENQSPPTRQG